MSAVGVIVPARAPAPYLGEAIAAILAQEPEEIVVVDDASPEPLTVPDGVRLVRRDERGGPAGARQAGLEALATPLLALCDADDVWEQGKLAAQLEALAGEPQAAVCVGVATIIDGEGRETGEVWDGPAAGLPELYRHNTIPTSSALIRREPLEAAGGFASDVTYGVEDWDLWLRLLANGGGFVVEPKARIRYRRHGGGLTADVARVARSAIEIHERHGALVDAGVRAEARSDDLRALADGLVRERDYAGARAALRDAGELAPRDRLKLALLGVPGLRGVLGRRDPYR